MKNVGSFAGTVFNWFVAGIFVVALVLSIPYLYEVPEISPTSEGEIGSAGLLEGSPGLQFYASHFDINNDNPLTVIDWGECYESTNTTFDFWISNKWDITLRYVDVFASNATPPEVAEYLLFTFRVWTLDPPDLSSRSRLDLGLSGRSSKLVTLDLYIRPGLPRWIEGFNCSIHINGVWE